MIELNNISFSFDEKVNVFENISFTVTDDEVVAILGPSGCGKSTLLRCIAGLLFPLEGKIIINGTPPVNAQRSKTIGFAFQDATLLEWLSVEDNIRLPNRIGKKINFHASKIDDLLELIGLSSAKHLKPSELSGGMKQRVSFARALYSEPKLLLLDEPFSALDLLTKTKLLGEFSAILKKLRTPTVIVTHHIEEAIMLADKVIILSGQPATVSKQLKVNIEKPRDYRIIEDKSFRGIVEECRNFLLSI